ncbi:iron ABC transporter permease [Reinekea marina]|uniref:FecCD family ABC transporter permease n=1 Tax=Reinekea marina TaxID=1310421 RepID=A0ABV7WQJ2_9GAMM|nr:iron ABC transporter permease [Reinekea marina]MDN3647586.1 iron ABC transporter permease [Reinekea marina]
MIQSTFTKIISSQPSYKHIYSALLIALILVAIGSTLAGSYKLSLEEVWQGLLDPHSQSSSTLMLWEFRLPRLASALFVGALFASSGFLLQGLTRNPLADPSLIGVSQGAALAVVLFVVLYPQELAGNRVWAAMSGACLAAFLIYTLTARKNQSASPLVFILTGVGLSLFITALTSTFLTYGQLENVMTALSWLSGSLHRVSASDVSLLCISTLLILPSAWILAHFLKAQQLGNELAQSLGVPLKAIHSLQLLVAVLAAAIATAVVGPIGFIGLIAPHIARKLTLGSPRHQLILSMFVGALLVSGADLLGRTLWAPVQIPAGIVSTLAGAPLLLILLFTNPKKP